FQGDIVKTSALQAALDDIDGADAFDDLRIDRAPVAGLEPAGAAREVDAGPRLARDGRGDAIDVVQNVLHAVGELVGALSEPEDAAQKPHRGQRVSEAAVDEQVGDRGLALHAVGERDIRVRNRSEVDDQIGLCGHHDFKDGRVAASGEAGD